MSEMNWDNSILSILINENYHMVNIVRESFRTYHLFTQPRHVFIQCFSRLFHFCFQFKFLLFQLSYPPFPHMTCFFKFSQSSGLLFELLKKEESQWYREQTGLVKWAMQLFHLSSNESTGGKREQENERRKTRVGK